MKRIPVSMRLKGELKAALEQIAERESRSLSNMVECLVPVDSGGAGRPGGTQYGPTGKEAQNTGPDTVVRE